MGKKKEVSVFLSCSVVSPCFHAVPHGRLSCVCGVQRIWIKPRATLFSFRVISSLSRLG